MRVAHQRFVHKLVEGTSRSHVRVDAELLRMGSLADISRRITPRSLRPTLKRVYYRSLTPRQRRAHVAGQLRGQAGVCRRFSSPLYASLLDHAAADVERSGPCWAVLGHEGATALGADDAMALRFAGAVHRLALSGKAPALAAHYPTTGGDGDPGRAWEAFLATVAANPEELRTLIRQGVQTNEVGRCALLAGGFLTVARETGLPLHVLEMGASAGLNLLWDRYHYERDGVTWGDPDSPVHLGSAIVSGTPPYDVEAQVVGRAGCDIAPIDPFAADGRLVLASFIWADQVERLGLLRGALAVAEETRVVVEQSDGPSWVERELAPVRDGVATVVFHSFVWQFIDDAGRRRIQAAFERAAARATASSPVAWLRMEWGSGQAEVRLTTWPGGEERLLAVASPQATDARWLI